MCCCPNSSASSKPSRRRSRRPWSGPAWLKRPRAHASRLETEALRNSLLSAISHDLRTPLAVIAGAASGLLEKGEQLRPAARAELARTVYDEAQQMSTLISNLLDMTRLESGTANLNREWIALEEIVGSAVRRMSDRLGERRIQISLPPELPLLRLDGVLIEQVFVNLLDNIVKYTPPQTTVWIRARAKERLKCHRLRGRRRSRPAARGRGARVREISSRCRARAPSAVPAWGWPSAAPSFRRTKGASGRSRVSAGVSRFG